MLHLATTHDCYKYLKNRFNKSLVQPLQKRLQEVQVPGDAEPQVAAHKPNSFNGPCRKCGECGHKARECGKVRIKSGSVAVEEKLTGSRRKPRHHTEGSRVEEKGRKDERATTRAGGHEAAAMTAGMSLATSTSSPEPNMASWEAHDETSDAANPNTTCAGPTRPEDESPNPPEALPSTSLEGGSRTGVSDELGRVPNNETTILQSTWMLRDESPSREVHGVARSHKEAAGVNVEGGEAGERTRTGDDEERRARERIDDRETEMASRQVDDEAADTTNPHAKCAGPTSCLESEKVAGWLNPNPNPSACQLRGGVVEWQLTALTNRRSWVTTQATWRAKTASRSTRRRRLQGRPPRRESTHQSRRQSAVRVRTDDRQHMSKTTISAPHGTTSTHLKHPRHRRNHLTTPRDDETSPRAPSSKGRGKQPRAATSSAREPKRTRR